MNTFFYYVNNINGDNMKEEIELLNFIYQDAKMGLIDIDNIKDSIKSKKLSTTIKKQEEKYFEICTTATDLLTLLNEEREDISNISKIMSYIEIRINVMNDSSTNNLARIIINENNKGIIDIQEKINNYNGKNKKVINLAKKLLQLKKQNIETLKKFL